MGRNNHYSRKCNALPLISNLMTTSKAIRYTLLFPATYFIISLFLFKGSEDKGDGVKFILTSILVCLIFWGIGLFFGIIISAIIQSPSKEPYFYFTGQSLIIVIILSFAGYDIYEKHQHEKEFGNIEHNRSYLYLSRDGEITSYSNPLYVKTAFNQLENEFPGKNDFRLTDFFSFLRDSTNGSYTDKLHIVYFTYTTKDKKEFFSKIAVFENKATTEILHGDLLTNQDYINSKSESLKEREKTDKLFNESLKELRKSIKKN